MFRKIFWGFMVCLCFGGLGPPEALACACCADRGDYSISVRKPNDYLLAEMEKIDFAPKATLYTTEAGLLPDVIRGLPADYYQDDNAAFSEDFGFSGLFAAKQWKLTFKDYKGRTGNLLLTQPPTILRFAVDTHTDDAGANVTLYKEWRMQGVAKGAGIFQSGMAPNTKFFLVFQGRGNNCDSAADFSHWRVEITGAKASYAFWGQLKQ